LNEESEATAGSHQQPERARPLIASIQVELLFIRDLQKNRSCRKGIGRFGAGLGWLKRLRRLYPPSVNSHPKNYLFEKDSDFKSQKQLCSISYSDLENDRGKKVTGARSVEIVRLHVSSGRLNVGSGKPTLKIL